MDRSLVNRFVVIDESGSDEAQDLAKQLATEISEDHASLVELVQLLGDYLTQDDPVSRTKATACLSAVLGELPKEKLTKQQTSVVTAFLNNRIEDEDALSEVAVGLRHVATMRAFSPMNIEGILKMLENTVNMRKHPQIVRYEVFRLLEVLLERYNGSGEDIIKAYVALTNGEKDPRNLLISFTLCKNLMLRFDVKEHAESLFDVTFCYFPITFEPPKNDPYKITKEDLKLALNGCLAGSGHLATFVIPGLIEKLNASTQAVKIDAMRTLRRCLQGYPIDVVANSWQEVWDSVKFEVIHGSDEAETAESALEVLEQLSAKLESTSSHQDFLDAVKKESQQRLEDPQSKLAGPTATLAAGIASSNDSAFSALAPSALSVTRMVGENLSIEKFKGVVDVVNKFLRAATFVGRKDGDLLLDFKDRTFQVLLKALASSDTALRLSAVGGLGEMCSLSALLDTSELGLIVQQLTNLLIENDNNTLCEKTLSTLVAIAGSNPDIIFNVSIPCLVAALPESLVSTEIKTSQTLSKEPVAILGYLSALTVGRRLLESVSVRLLSKLSGLVQTGTDYEYPLLIIRALVSAVENIPLPDHTKSKTQAGTGATKSFLPGAAFAYLTAFAPQMISLFVRSGNFSILDHDSVVNAGADYLSAIVRRVPAKDVAGFANELLNLFVFSHPSKLVAGEFDSSPFAILSEGSRPSRLLALFMGGFGPLPVASYSFTTGQADDLIHAAVNLLGQTRAVYVRAAYLRLIGLISNKNTPNVDSISAELRDHISGPSEDSLNALEALCWLAKGLVLKGDAAGYSLSEYLIGLLDDKSLSRFAARILGVLFLDDAVLSKNNGVAVRLLYKQRLFSMAEPRIVVGFRQRPELKVSYLIALASILRFTPSKIVVPQLPNILPLLLESLCLKESLVQEAAINTIFVTLIDGSSSFAEHTDELTSRLLSIAQDRSSIPSVRALALSCLAAFPKTFHASVVFRLKTKVISELSVVLDDPRRDVRREAVACRQAFYSA